MFLKELDDEDAKWLTLYACFMLQIKDYRLNNTYFMRADCTVEYRRWFIIAAKMFQYSAEQA